MAKSDARFEYKSNLGLTDFDLSQSTNPNDFMSVRINTRRFSDSYQEHMKHRRVINNILSS